MNYFIFVLFVTFYCGTGANVMDDNKDTRYCFNFAWIPGWGGEMLNCSKANYPCTDKIIAALDPPNFANLWNEQQENYRCVLKDGFSCIKYTNALNGALLTSVHLCGKVIEDKIGIQDGCYTETKDGYDIEYCACQTSSLSPNKMPCNAAVGNISSLLGIILFSLFAFII